MGKTTWSWADLIAIVCMLGGVLGGTTGCGGATAEAPGASSANKVSEEHHPDDGEVAAPNGVVRKSGSGSVSARLGPPGGTLELNDGPRVEIPPGAVEGGVEFVLKVAQKTTAFGNKENEKAIGPTFSFSPDVNAPEGRSIIVSFPLSAAPEGWGDPAIAYEQDEGTISYGEDSTRTKWQYEAAKLSGGRIMAELPALNGLRMQFVLSNLQAQ